MYADDYIINDRAVSVWHEQPHDSERFTFKLDTLVSVQFQPGPPHGTRGTDAPIVWHVIARFGAAGEQFTFTDKAKARDLAETLDNLLLWGRPEGE